MDQNFEYRFGGIQRLFGRETETKLTSAHICVIGIGGVGSWCTEALARSGIGQLTLIDFDEVCVSNTNRQLHALDSTVGKMKIEVMGERMMQINPALKLDLRNERFDDDTYHSILETRFSYVIDAIDTLSKKCLLLSECRKREQRVITVGSGGGRRDPTQIRHADLAKTEGDRLLQRTRKKLRQDFDFPRGRELFGIPAVFSLEEAYYPTADGCVSQNVNERPDKPLDCNSGLGTASFLTGSLGFAAAYRVVRDLVSTQ